MKLSSLPALFLSSAILFSCSQPTTPTPATSSQANSIAVDVKNDSAKNPEVEGIKETKFQFTQKLNGVDNPVGPENIDSVEIAGKIFKVSEIKITKSSFSTKATSDQVSLEYLGSGNYKVNLADNEISKLASLVIKFNLINSKSPVLFPLVKGVIDNDVRVSYDPATGGITGGIVNKDGSIDKTKPIFTSTGDKFTVQEANGNQSVFDNSSLNKKEQPKPEKQMTLSADDTKKQLEILNKSLVPVNSFASYVGLWLFSGLGQKIIVNVTDLGNGQFSAKAKVDQDYSATGSYSVGDTSVIAKSNGLIFELKLSGNNQMKLTLKEANNKTLKFFLGTTVDLDRVAKE